MTSFEKFLLKPLSKNGLTLQDAICLTILVGMVAYLCIRRH